MRPLISIITINLNNRFGLYKTICSVIEQSFREFEFIVIDGGSSDGSLEIINQFKENIDFWVSEPDKGIYHAMNRGLNVANGEYLLFLNSGDHFYTREVLKENLEFIKEYDFIYFDVQIVDSKSKFIKIIPLELSFSFFLKDSLPHQATFIKASAFKRCGNYAENYKIVSDWKFFVEGICRFNLKYKKIDSVLSTHYLDGISGDPANLPIVLREREEVLKNNFPNFIKDYAEMEKLKELLTSIRTSRRIRWLIKLNFLKEF